MSLQMMVPRAADAAQVQHNLNQANAMQSDFQAIQQKEEDKLKQEQVREKDNVEDGRIKDDPDRQRKQGGQGSSSRHQASSSEEENVPDPVKYAKDPSRGNLLDISF
ncbi:hypothetical protein FZ040_06445 [Selenomonas ruminis]|uniref:Uncharacterized protein n=2 Tax=Selenomonas ruminis TaxID=2593411 RepID=A0A5D6W9A3_9FIRM|nr:hypothetical protein FZ040_06445 [Selenomonas sp. mPRGC5]